MRLPMGNESSNSLSGLDKRVYANATTSGQVAVDPRNKEIFWASGIDNGTLRIFKGDILDTKGRNPKVVAKRQATEG